jgi:GNAT superfamily N-acetyltransferase
MKISIRTANSVDAEIITSFNSQMAWETEGRRLDPLILVQGVSMLLENPSRGFYLLAEIEGNVVGQCMITYEWSDWRCGDFWWIQSVYIVPDCRRKGVFKALYSHVLKAARATDLVVGIRLYVERDNSGAIQTYLNVGLNQAHYSMLEQDFTMK